MSRLSDNLYSFIKKHDGKVALADICSSPDFSGEDRKDISAALRFLGSKKYVFRSLNNGKAYYSAKPEDGEAMNPTKAWIGDTALALGGIVNRGASNTDILFKGQNNPTGELFNALDKLSDQLKKILGDDLVTGNESSFITDFSFNEKKTVKGNGYEFEIPDGFTVIEGKEAQERFGENRDFMAYLKNPLFDDEDEDEAEGAIIKIYPGQTFPFTMIDNETLKVYYPLVADCLFKYEQGLTMEQLFSSGMHNEAYLVKTKDGIGWCATMDSSTPDHSGGYYFFYLNIQTGNEARMFRVDISDYAAENGIEAKKLFTQIAEHISYERKVLDHKALNDRCFTDSVLNKTSAEEWKEVLSGLMTNVLLYQKVGVEAIKKEVSIDINSGTINSDSATLSREIKRHAKAYLEEEAALIDEILKEVSSFFLKASEKNKESIEIYELQNYVLEQFSELKEVSITIDEGGKIVVPVSGYDDFLAAVNNPILEERKEKQLELQLQKEKEEKYQKALSLGHNKKYKKKKEAIELLEELGDYKDAAEELSRQKEAFTSMDDFERYDYIAEEIENSLKEEDNKQEKAYPEKNASVDKETEDWIKRKTYVKEAIETRYTTGQDLIGRQMQAGSFSGINDPVLRTLIEKNRELMNQTMSQRENLLDEIYRYFKNVKTGSYSKRSLNKLIKFYEEVYDDGNGYSLVINGINLAEKNFKGIYATRLEEMRRAIINKTDGLSTSKDKEREKQKNIDKALEKAEKSLKELRDEAEANEMKALSLESEQINNQMELDRKKASLHEDNDRREKYAQQEIQSIKDEIQTNEVKRKQLSEELSKAEKELEGVFVLNFGKRKELKGVIDSLKIQISDLRNTISDLSNKMIKVQKNKQNQIYKENENISSLEKKIIASMTEKRELEKKKQMLIEEICSAEKEQEAIDKIKKDFHTLYLIKEYGSKYGYDDIVQELKEKGLDYEKYLIKDNTVPKSTGVQPDKPAKSQIEKDKDLIREALKRSRTPQTATLLANKTGLSLNRVSALLSQMKEDNEVIRTVSQRTAYFELHR